MRVHNWAKRGEAQDFPQQQVRSSRAVNAETLEVKFRAEVSLSSLWTRLLEPVMKVN